MSPGGAAAGGRLTTHVLDTMAGRPAAGVAIELYRLDGEQRSLLAAARTNADGRCDGPLLAGEAFVAGIYELSFDVGAYFAAAGGEPPFLDWVPVRFGIADAARHYHVPLLIAPYGYTTYRGS